jgi:hypothetical protein
MVIDTEDCNTYFLRWAKHGEEDITGKRIPPKRTFDRGYCILLDETKKCKIQPVKPRETQNIRCWTSVGQAEWGLNAWNSTDIYSFIPEFKPHEPFWPDPCQNVPGWTYWYSVIRGL